MRAAIIAQSFFSASIEAPSMDVENLISQVFMRPALWDKCDKNHHNRFVLDKLWSEIAQEMNTKQNAVKSKWKTLRDKFRTVLVSIPKPKSGDAQDCVDYTGEWKYYKSLLFLKDQFTPRQSSGNLGVTTPEPSLQESAEEDIDFEEDIGESTELFSAPSTGNSVSSIASQSVKPKMSTLQKRRTKENIGDKLVQVEMEKLKYLQNKKPKNEDDEDLNFFKSLLPHIKTLPPLEKLEYRMQVMKITQDFVRSTTSTSFPQTNAPTTQYTGSQSASATKSFYENVNLDLTEEGNTLFNLQVL